MAKKCNWCIFFCDLPFKVQQIDARDQPKGMQQPRNVQNLVPFSQTSKQSWPKSVTGASFFVTCLSKYIRLILKINLKLCSSLGMFKVWCPFLKPVNSHLVHLFFCDLPFKVQQIKLVINLKPCSSLEMLKIWCPLLKPVNGHGPKV